MNNYFSSARNPVYYIAEIGGNHEGNKDYAMELARLAARSGADAIKFQLYTGDSLVSRIESPDRNRHFKKFELGKADYQRLIDYCASVDRDFMASVWDKALLDWVDPFIKIHKVGSGDLTCYPLLKLLVATGKPIILSTGLSTLEEVKNTVEYISSLDASYVNDKKLALLQCTSSYPTPDEDANINAMLALRDEFNLPVGYSDHTIGSDAIEVAVALGAQIIEKHFTDSREEKEFRDHKVSLTCDETYAFLRKAERIITLKGKAKKVLTHSERDAGHQISFRRSVYAARPIKKGEEFTHDNITVLRPMHGVPATSFDAVIGKVSKRDLDTHEVLNDGDLS